MASPLNQTNGESEEMMAQNDWLNAVSKDRTLSRRKMIISGGIGVAGLSIGGWVARAGASPPMKGSIAGEKSTSIHQEIDREGRPQRAYETILERKAFSW